MMRRDRIVGLVAAAALALAVSACGSDDHPNENRPPAPIELTGKVTNDKVTVNPDRVGAGLVNLTFTNLSKDPVELAFEGPTSASAPVLEPGQVTTMKVDLEQGSYSVTAGGESSAAPESIEVGPERASSQNELLLP